MFDFLKKKPQGDQITFNIQGMHCTSCSINIDSELEETEGVISATTSYPKARTEIIYDSKKVSPQTLKKVIESLDYQVSE
jgi:copper chaperone CopZ